MGQITRKSPSSKPSKPYADFPLFAHATRRWAKKIRGKLHYFGPWADPEGALQNYLEQRDDLHAGRSPRSRLTDDGLSVRDLCNHFLSSKHQKLETGEITKRSFGDYYRVCQRIITVFGKMRLVSDLNVDDFDRLRSEISRTWGPVGLGNEINRIRMVFKYGQGAGLLTHRVNFGPNFKRPSRRVLRKCRAANGPRMFEANQIRTLLAANYKDRESGFRERPDFRAIILLGINCGFGNADVGLLRRQSVDLPKGWVNFPRPKTGVPRRCPLWPQTVVAIRQALESRVMPIDSQNEELVFLTKKGRCWHNDSPSSPLSAEFRKLVQSVDRQAERRAADEGNSLPASIYRRGLGFYALRHTFETIAGETRDQVAVDHIMGHERDDMATVYRERISDERLIAVTQHVHDWLFRGTLPVESQTKNG